MQKRILAIVITLSATLFLASCGKEGDNTPAPKTKTELITSSPWVFLSASANSTDVSSAPQLACFKDNTITFTSSTAGNITEGTIICSPTTAGNFTWSFQSGETIVRLSAPLFPGGSNDFTLVSLNETNLVLSQAMTIPPIGATTIQVTFKH